MVTLNDDLKRILSGLGQQDAGEYLPLHDKLNVLGFGTETSRQSSPPPRKIARKPATYRIGLISDGRGVGAPLDYAIEACARQGAKIDLLLHGAIEPACISALETQIRLADLEFNRIQLGLQPVDDIVNYICNHPSLTFLVAMPDDPAIKELVEELTSKRRGRIPVPLALIENQPSARPAKQSAA